jgi:hypothetical protein
MRDTLDLDRYPLDKPDSPALGKLISECRAELSEHGMFNLDGFLRAEAVTHAVAELQPRCARSAYTHQRGHNVYFKETVDGLAADHPALLKFDTLNHTLCGDQLTGTLVQAVYDWNPLCEFLARVLQKPMLFPMEDALARVNVLEYRPGETLNWHFDRSQFTTTLLLQAAESGGEFEYRSRLRSDDDPNYAGVARAIRGEDPEVRVNTLTAGTLNVFAGRNTLHRVSTVRGGRNRLVAVFSYYDRRKVTFSATERIGFYGRSE